MAGPRRCHIAFGAVSIAIAFVLSGCDTNDGPSSPTLSTSPGTGGGGLKHVETGGFASDLGTPEV